MPRMKLLSVAQSGAATVGTPVHIGRAKPPYVIRTLPTSYSTATVKITTAAGCPGTANQPASTEFITDFGTNTTTADVVDTDSITAGGMVVINHPVSWIRAESVGTEGGTGAITVYLDMQSESSFLYAR